MKYINSLAVNTTSPISPIFPSLLGPFSQIRNHMTFNNSPLALLAFEVHSKHYNRSTSHFPSQIMEYLNCAIYNCLRSSSGPFVKFDYSTMVHLNLIPDEWQAVSFNCCTLLECKK